MSLSKKIAALRQKPRRVRERYVLVAMLVLAPVLIVVWIATYRYDSATSGADFFKSVGTSISSSFNSPVYKDTFGGGTAAPVTATSTPPVMTATTTP